MYHLMMQPNNIADIDGRYRGIDDNIHTSPTGEYYSTFSLWDNLSQPLIRCTRS